MRLEYLAVVLLLLFTVATSVPLGGYMYRVFTGGRTWLDPVLGPIERLVFRLVGVDTSAQQGWKQYSVSLLVSNLVMWLATWPIVTLQQQLPLNPDGIGNMDPTLAFNAISSFGPNAAHPYENPTPVSTIVETWSISIIPMAMVVMLGHMLQRRKLAVVIYATMLAIYLPMVVLAVAQESGGSPALAAMGVDQATGSMEGKEVRIGPACRPSGPSLRPLPRTDRSTPCTTR